MPLSQDLIKLFPCRRLFRPLSLGISLLFLLAACFKSEKTQDLGSSESKTYQMGGSTTVDPIAQIAIENFRRENPDYNLSYNGVGSSNGVKGVLDGTYLLGGSSRELKESEITAGVKTVTIAIDGISVVVNKSSTIKDLTKEQILNIFTGKITNWQEIGGPDALVVVIVREESSGTRVSFDELALEKHTPTQEAITTVSNGDMAIKLNNTPYSIGYLGFGYLDQLDQNAHAVSIEGVAPREEMVLSGAYPLARDLYIVYTGELDGFKKDFADYLLSPLGQEAVTESGFLPIQ